MSGTLFVVGTPIGNLGDFSPRAIEVLKSVDFIAAEDTRVTRKLLTHFDIKNELISCFEHSSTSRLSLIVDRLLSGQSCAVVTDAGMPCISDPGEDLVRMCHDAGVHVEAVPGPSALITALAVSGMKSGRFCFEGFLSVNKPSRAAHLFSLKNETRTMIFYEAPHKLSATLCDMLEYFGNRQICLIKELTKLHESTERTSLSDAAEKYKTEQPRGEYVLIIAGAESAADSPQHTLEQAVEIARNLMDKGESASYAAKAAAVETGFKKSDIYKLLI